MQEEKLIVGQTQDEIFEQLSKEFATEEGILQYRAVLKQQKAVLLDIDIDLGGGFEGGYETTTLSAPISNNSGFRFAIHNEGLLDEVGKFFGMQDVVIGYPDFDKKVIVKTNDESKVRDLFTDEQVRNTFASLTNFVLHIVSHHGEHNDVSDTILELTIEEGITDVETLKPLYNVFYKILNLVDQDTSGIPKDIS